MCWKFAIPILILIHLTEVDGYFKRIINLYKQMNYSEFRSEKFNKFEKELGSIKRKTGCLKSYSIRTEKT